MPGCPRGCTADRPRQMRHVGRARRSQGKPGTAESTRRSVPDWDSRPLVVCLSCVEYFDDARVPRKQHTPEGPIGSVSTHLASEAYRPNHTRSFELTG